MVAVPATSTATDGAPATSTGVPRSRRLDAIRGLGALAVLMVHIDAEVNGFVAESFSRQALLGAGLSGLFAFFALSGYLLYLPFARRDFGGGPPVSLRSYTRNRAVRIFPLYFVVLALLLVINGGTPRLVLRFFTFTQNFSEDLVAKAVDGPMWSLVVELHFYLLLPLLAAGVAAVARGSRRRALYLLGGLAVATMILRHAQASPPEVLQYSLPGTLHYFLGGMALALIRAGDEVRFVARLPAVARRADVWVLAALPLYFIFFVSDYRLAPLALLATFLLVGHAALPLRRGGVDRLFDLRFLVWVGVISYSVYLWHVPLLDWLPDTESLGWTGVARLSLLGVPVSLAVGWISYQLVEMPGLRLRRPWFGRDVAAADAPALWRTWWPWAAVGAGALAVRAGVAALTYPPTLGPDAADYDRLARSLAFDGTFGQSLLAAGGGDTAFRPPGYPGFLGAVYRATDGSLPAAILTQAVLGALTAVLVGALAARLWRRRTGLIAGVIAAVYPPLVLASVAPMSEALFLPLEAGALLAAVEHRRGGHRAYAVAAGALCGLGVLTRPAGLVLVPVVALLALPPGTLRGANGWRRRGLIVPAAVVAAAAVVVLPWVVRSSVALDTFVPVSTVDAFNLAGTYNTETADDPANPGIFRPPSFVEEHAARFQDRSLDEGELAAELRDGGIGYLTDNPLYVVEVMARSTLRLADLRGPDLTRQVYAVDYGYAQPRWADLAFVSWWAIVPFALAGLVLQNERGRTLVHRLFARSGRLRRRAALAPASPIGSASGPAREAPLVLWVAPALLWGVTVPVLGHARLRAPIEPFVVLLAAVAVAALVDRFEARRRRSAADQPPQPSTGGTPANREPIHASTSP